MPVLSKGCRFRDIGSATSRNWTVLRKIGEGQSAEVFSVKCDEEPSVQVSIFMIDCVKSQPVKTNLWLVHLACCQDRTRTRSPNPQSRAEGKSALLSHSF